MLRPEPAWLHPDAFKWIRAQYVAGGQGDDEHGVPDCATADPSDCRMRTVPRVASRRLFVADFAAAWGGGILMSLAVDGGRRMRVVVASWAVLLAGVVAAGEVTDPRGIRRCLDSLPLALDIADRRTQAIAWQAITPERFAKLDADVHQRLPGVAGNGLAAPGSYDAFRAAIRALPALEGLRMAPEHAGWYVANRVPPAESTGYWQCINSGALVVSPAVPLTDDGPIVLRIQWSDLRVDHATPLHWAGVNLRVIVPPPSIVSGTGNATAEFARVPSQSVTLVVEVETDSGLVRARFADPLPPRQGKRAGSSAAPATAYVESAPDSMLMP